MPERLIYLDNAATTRLDDAVLEAMIPYFVDKYAVATSQFGYSPGIDAKDALDAARSVIASALGAEHDEVIFTSGSTESGNMAIKGVAAALGGRKGKRIVTSPIEDFPVLHSIRALEREGFAATYVDVDDYGRLDTDQLRDAITSDTILVSVQSANQEIGTLQDVSTIGAICREKGVLLHVDATHSFPRIPLDVRHTPADLITVTAHLVHGPKGVGALYVRKGTPLTKWMDGGFQEYDRRGGEENIPGAVGFARAVELATESETQRLQSMRDALIERLLQIPHSRLNGHPIERLPQNANISFRFVEGESILLHLDMHGIAVSTGSACFSRSLQASHVMLAIGGDHERAHGSVRFTFGRYNHADEVDEVSHTLTRVIARLREISPLGKE